MRVTTSAAAIAALLAAGPALADEALTGATVIDGTGRAIANAVVVIGDGRIACVGSAQDCLIPAGTRQTDLAGRFITPGLVDAHVHFAQTGWIDGRPDGLEDKAVYHYEKTVAALRADPGRWHRSYLCTGVTGVFDVGGAPWTVDAARAAGDLQPDRAHARAAGPLITHDGPNQAFSYGTLADQPMFLAMDGVETVRADVAKIKAMGASAVKVWYLAPKPEDKERLDALLMETGRAARAAGLSLLVHATELDSAKTALRAGAAMLVHSVEDAPVDAEFLALLKANDAVYAPTLVVGLNWSRAALSIATGEPVAVDDPNRCVDGSTLDMIGKPGAMRAAFETQWGGKVTPIAMSFVRRGDEAQTMARNLRAVRDAGGRIALATDAGNPLTLHGPSALWEMEAMQQAGLSAEEVLHAATAEAARASGLEKVAGTIAPGRPADLLVLTEDPRKDIRAIRSLSHVMRAGVLKTQKELQVR